MRKVNLKNLRVNGSRVPQDIWAEAAESLLPGPAPSASDIKHGKSKSAVLKRICATDKVMRRKATDLCAELMSRAAKAEAREAGWLSPSEAPSAKLDEKTLAELTELLNPTSPSAIPLCGVCGGPATRQLKAGLNTQQLGHYCDRHDWRGSGAGVPPGVMAMPRSAWLP